MRNYHQVSRLFRPVVKTPKDAKISKKDISLPQKLLEDMGFISRRDPGMYALLPLGMRVINKITNIIDEEMEKINAQKISLPFLTNNSLWKLTGRSEGTELFKVTDREKRHYILGPTHEESMTDLICNSSELSQNVMPLRVYQINNKFRDEIRPRFGLIRSRDFLMKDLYTFDISSENALNTYHEVSDAYHRILTKIDVPFHKVEGDCGDIGGSMSHEYHYKATIGDDVIMQCSKCDVHVNKALAESVKCPHCQENMKESKGIEVAHTFLLDTKYSAVLTNKESKAPLHMGCYGIGVTRLLGACVEVLSSAKSLKWPRSISPFQICIICSSLAKYESTKTPLNYLPEVIQEINLIERFKNEILVDDRYELGVGVRVVDAKKCGYSFIVVLGKKVLEDVPLYEVINTNLNTVNYFTLNELCTYLSTV